LQDPWQSTLAWWLRLAKTAFDVCALAWLALAMAQALRRCAGDRPRRHGADAPAADNWRGSRLSRSWKRTCSHRVDRTPVAPGRRRRPGTYEYYARDIQLNGLLMRVSLEGPYYNQVLYPYFLAGAHALFGEGMFGLVLLQRLLTASIVLMVVDIAVVIGGEAVWLAAFASAIFFTYLKVAPISAKLLTSRSSSAPPGLDGRIGPHRSASHGSARHARRFSSAASPAYTRNHGGAGLGHGRCRPAGGRGGTAPAAWR